MARSGPNGAGGNRKGLNKGISNRKHAGGKFGNRKEERRAAAESRAKSSAPRRNTGIRSVVRYGHLDVEEALSRPVSEETRGWLLRRKRLAKAA